MPTLKDNIRKLIIGESFGNSIKYQKGSSYRLPRGSCILTDLIKNEDDPEVVDLFLRPEGEAKFLWKSISTRMLLEVEYDSDF
tara:strand:+ start:9870 stop:10118 length:249 start_codon:yes stop_codon:yes gene_type:complete